MRSSLGNEHHELLVIMVTSDMSDSEAKCPEFKVVAVRIRKARRVKEQHTL